MREGGFTTEAQRTQRATKEELEDSLRDASDAALLAGVAPLRPVAKLAPWPFVSFAHPW